MQFRPFVYDATNQQVPVAIKPIEPQDAATTIKEPRQQTDRTSEYVSNSKFDIYGLNTWSKEFPISSFLGQKRPQTLMPQRLEGILSLGKDEVGSSNLPSNSKKSCFLSKTGLLLCLFLLYG